MLPQKQINPPYLVFIFRDDSGLVLGEFDPMLGDDAWAGNDKDSILSKEIAYWYISWNAQDTDGVQFWIPVKAHSRKMELKE